MTDLDSPARRCNKGPRPLIVESLQNYWHSVLTGRLFAAVALRQWARVVTAKVKGSGGKTLGPLTPPPMVPEETD